MDAYLRLDFTCGGSARVNEYAHLSADEYALMEEFANKHGLRIEKTRLNQPYVSFYGDSEKLKDLAGLRRDIPFLDVAKHHFQRKEPEYFVYFGRKVSIHDSIFNENQLEMWDTHLIGIKPCR